jgi:undecaprenyl-diphosphatase
MLAGVGFVIYWVDVSFPSLRPESEMRFKDALWIGIAQAFAISPGVSRSGSTMGMGRLLGFSREGAARFSFLLSLPITAAAFLFEFRDLTRVTGISFSWDYCLTGLVISFVFGIASIHGLLLYLRHANFKVFAWYRLMIAVAIIAFVIFKNA